MPMALNGACPCFSDRVAVWFVVPSDALDDPTSWVADLVDPACRVLMGGRVREFSDAVSEEAVVSLPLGPFVDGGRGSPGACDIRAPAEEQEAPDASSHGGSRVWERRLEETLEARPDF